VLIDVSVQAATSSSTSTSKCRTSTPLYGLDSYTGQFSRRTGAAANNIYNLADFMLGLRSQYALSTFLVANMQQTCTSPTCRTTSASTTS
jgi:hypothetical protein